MKRLIRKLAEPEILNIKIDVYFKSSSTDIAATDVSPVTDENNNIDQQALANYNSFIQTVWNVVEYYGFEMFKNRSSKSYPGTSKYAWVAYASEVDKDDTPLIIKLRVSDHLQEHLSPDHIKDIKDRDKADADELKRPKTKQKQRYILADIVVNNTLYHTYEEALNYVDEVIHNWLTKLHVDTSEFEDLGKW